MRDCYARSLCAIVMRDCYARSLCTVTLPFTTVESESFRELVEIIRKLEGGANIVSALINICDEFGIINKILGINLDNAANNITFLEAFESGCTGIGGTFTKYQGHVRCIVHVINLALQDFLHCLRSEEPDQDEDDLHILNQVNTSQTPTIKKLRKLIAKLRSLPQRRRRLSEQCLYLHIQHREPILDSKTRWNSTLNMIERAISMSSAINRMISEIQEINELSLSIEEWDMLKEVSLPLKTFHDVSKILCGESYVTMPLAIPAYNLIIDDLEEKGLSSIINKAIDAALTKLKSYYVKCDNPIYAITTPLDPRLKKIYYE
ncbi:27935_t:CDS:1 [Gigaspora margarita]|uniref:27935_t:CDS:1 n=1 Tax=Gigaspora margarita TaxID=4874 RepID=A0ABM8W3T7_GIGMA|nr:27935_t:CDS:1 [Gigaspora margarita]